MQNHFSVNLGSSLGGNLNVIVQLLQLESFFTDYTEVCHQDLRPVQYSSLGSLTFKNKDSRYYRHRGLC